MATKNGNTGERLTAAERKRIKRALKNDGIPRGPLARALQQRIVHLGLSRDEAGKRLKDAPSQMSRLMTGHIDEFSADRIAKMLVRAGADIDVHVSFNSVAFIGDAARPKYKRGRVSILINSTP